MARITKLELVRLLYGDPMQIFASILRGIIVAPKGRKLYCADYAAIEARVVFWLADHKDGLDAFALGRPIYEEMAAEIYSKLLSEVTKSERELGKRAVLGCGFNMGHLKFRETCKQQANIDISEELAKVAVNMYRTKHVPVVRLWSNIERAAIAATKNPGKRYTINHTAWWVKDRFLWCRLPSGRCIAYRDPTVRQELPRWGGNEKRPVLYHWSVDPKTHQWVNGGTYGGRLVENITQAVARDVMAEAMLRCKPKGYDIVLTVHDEILAECDEGLGAIDEFCNLVSELPPWATGLPVKAEGWTGYRYKKG